jgi:hypothetical protein
MICCAWQGMGVSNIPRLTWVNPDINQKHYVQPDFSKK